MASEKEWYVSVEGKAEGPFTLRDLDVKFRTKELTSNTPLWSEGMAEWQSAFKISEVKSLI